MSTCTTWFLFFFFYNYFACLGSSSKNGFYVYCQLWQIETNVMIVSGTSFGLRKVNLFHELLGCSLLNMTCTLVWLSVRNQLIKFNLILLNSDIVFWSMIFLIGCLLLHRINYDDESQPVQSNLKNMKILSVQLLCTVQQELVIFSKVLYVGVFSQQQKKTSKKSNVDNTIDEYNR